MHFVCSGSLSYDKLTLLKLKFFDEVCFKSKSSNQYEVNFSPVKIKFSDLFVQGNPMQEFCLMYCFVTDCSYCSTT